MEKGKEHVREQWKIIFNTDKQLPSNLMVKDGEPCEVRGANK